MTGWPDQRPAYSSSIRPNIVLWRMKGGGLLDGPSLFSVNGRCIRLPLPGTSDTQRLIYATIRRTAQNFTDNDCTHRMRDRALPSTGWGATPRRISESAPFGPETGFQCIDARRTYQHTTLNDFTNEDETDDCTHRMRDRALPSDGRGATPRRISESAPFGPATGSQRIGARRTHLLTCLYIAALTLNEATDKKCGLKPLSTTYTVVNAEGRLVL